MSYSKKGSFLLISSLLAIIPGLSIAETKITEPMVSESIFAQADKNDQWKSAFATGKQAQIVFMNVTPTTNPNNEIGMETHKFDQVIFVTEGNGSAILNGKSSTIKTGDMIFIPLGTAHNVINANKDKPLKIISVYSHTDIPAGAAYASKADEPQN